MPNPEEQRHAELMQMLAAIYWLLRVLAEPALGRTMHPAPILPPFPPGIPGPP